MKHSPPNRSKSARYKSARARNPTPPGIERTSAPIQSSSETVSSWRAAYVQRKRRTWERGPAARVVGTGAVTRARPEPSPAARQVEAATVDFVPCRGGASQRGGRQG